MPYSITTRDGITINNIPDNLPPDHQSLKDRVAAIRAEADSGVAPVQEEVLPQQEQQAQQQDSRFNPLDDISLFGVTAGDVVGAGNLAKNIATGIVAKPIAGGVAIKDVLQGEGLRGAETVKRVTESIQTPLSERGQSFATGLSDSLSSLAENPAIDSIIKNAKSFGDVVKKLGEDTGALLADPLSTFTALGQGEDLATLEGRAGQGARIGGAIGEALPETAMDALALYGATGATVKNASILSKPKLPKAPTKSQVKAMLVESAPKLDDIKQSARSLYNEIDNSGLVLKGRLTQDLSKNVIDDLIKSGFNKRIHPKIVGVMEELSEISGKATKVTRLDQVRRVAAAAAKSIDPDEVRLAVKAIRKIDDTLDSLSNKQVVGNLSGEIGQKYKNARNLWGRVKKIELIDEALERASRANSGVENGIRNEFKRILNSKKLKRGFSKSELKAISDVEQGTGLSNMAKRIGKLGFGEGKASTMLLGGGGVAAGSALGGPVGAAIVPLFGVASRRLAKNLTQNSAQLAKSVVAAGGDSKKIIDAYFRSVKKADLSPQDLTELLIGKDLSKVNRKFKGLTAEQNQLIQDAVFFNNKLTEAELKRALGMTALTTNQQDDQ